MHNFTTIRPLLEPWGTLKSQPASEWTGEIPLPEIVREFYEQIGPYGETYHAHIGPVGLTINAGGNPVEVPPLSKLWGKLDCYRWHGLTGERLPDWLEHWLIVATAGADPFILDTQTGHVLFDLAGGGWNPRFFAPDLTSAMGGIATIANTLAALDEDAYDNSFALTPEAETRIEADLANFLGDAAAAKTMLSVWWWR